MASASPAEASARPVRPPAASPGSAPDGSRDATAPVRSALDLVVATTDADICCLMWHARDGGLHILDLSANRVPADRRRTWLRSSAQPGDERVTRSQDGTLVAPVRRGDGTIRGCLALRVRSGTPAADCRADRADHVVAAADHVSALLAFADQLGERPSAYHALFEIGTQIQAAESEPEAIFTLIVGRARQLLATDVAWLAMVDPAGKRLTMKVADGTTTPGFMAMAVDVGTGIGGIALQQKRPIAVRDGRNYADGMPASVHSALEDEGVTSILCAPMLRDGDMLGALYVGTRTSTEFTAEAASLLSALAAQAAVTIENARLYQALSEQNGMLERAFAVHRSLTDASLSGVGMHQIGLRLARLVEHDLLLTQHTSLPMCALYPCDPDATSHLTVDEAETGGGPDTPVLPLTAAGARLGTLRVHGAAPLSPLQYGALEYGATVLALELVKAQAELEVEWRLQGELLEELLRVDTLSDGLLRRARHFGVDLRQTRRMIVLEANDEAASTKLLDLVRRTLRHHGDGTSLVAQRGDRVLIALTDDPAGGVERLLTELRGLADRSGITACAGVSNARCELALAAREAESALALALRGGRPGAVVNYEELGPLRFLLDAPSTVEMRTLVEEYLGAIARKDAKHQSELLFTLRTFLETGGHHPTTAKRCQIHISTLKYRLSRISEVLGQQLGDPAVRFRLNLAFEVLTVLEALDSVPFDQVTPARRAT